MAQENQNNKSPCPLWLFGILLVGTTLLYLLFSHASSEKALWIQQDIQSRSSSNLSEQLDSSTLSIRADGRDIFLSGHLPSQDQRSLAEQIAAHTDGVRVVHNEIEIKRIATTAHVEEIPKDAIEKPPAAIAKARVKSLPTKFPPLEEEPVSTENNQQNRAIAATQKKLASLDFSSITFKKNSTALTTEAKHTLDEAANTLLEHQNVNIQVQGHTDSSGNAEHNLNLSKQRAQAVVEYLVISGVNNSRLEAEGFGDQFPIASNETSDGRKQNRRIEIKVINGE